VRKADMPWSLLAIAWLSAEHVLAARSGLQRLMAHFPYASCTPFSNGAAATDPAAERSGLLFRAASHVAVDEAVLQEIETLLGLNGPDVLRYADKKQGQRRAVHLLHGEAAVTLEGFLLAGDTRAQAWITTLLQDELPAHSYGRALLVPGAQPPIPVVSRGQTVCTCFNVTNRAIEAQLQKCGGTAQERLQTLQAALQCGTNCGSCVPQLQRMVRVSA
jgi:assimilatory nitrate reductase catalytic subunit